MQGVSCAVHPGIGDLLTEIPTLDNLLELHTNTLGNDFTGYRNHVYRVVNFCVALLPADVERLETIATAAAFHDMGIWTDKTFDYLQPSAKLARAHLAHSGSESWSTQITNMILEHHKIFPYRGDALVERFRRADWIDVSMGTLTYGLDRKFVKEVIATWPNAGFHKKLVQLELHRLRTHPWNPLPMMKL